MISAMPVYRLAISRHSQMITMTWIVDSMREKLGPNNTIVTILKVSTDARKIAAPTHPLAFLILAATFFSVSSSTWGRLKIGWRDSVTLYSSTPDTDFYIFNLNICATISDTRMLDGPHIPLVAVMCADLSTFTKG